MLKINGTAIPTPETMEWSLQDLSSDSSGRTLDGTMHKDIVTKKRKLSCAWLPMSWAKAAAFLQLVSASAFFELTYPDLASGTDETRTFYVGDRKASYFRWNEGKEIVSGIAFDFIER